MTTASLSEKFACAVRTLATSAAPIKDRLHRAFLSLHPIFEADMPSQELRQTSRLLLNEFSKVQDPFRGNVVATLEQMTDDEAEKVADLIWSICFGLQAWEKDSAGYRC